MTFDQAFRQWAVGERVRIADGLPEPELIGGFAWRLWRSHNFIGQVVEKKIGPPRSIRIQLPPTPTAIVSYTITEGVPHLFERA